MKSEEGLKKNFLQFYLDPELLSKEEAEEALRKIGVDVDCIEKKGEHFMKKLKAKITLSHGNEKKERFLKLIDQFQKETGSPIIDTNHASYKLAARKQNGVNGNDGRNEIDDAKLLEYLRKNKL
jgi:phosphotransferase system IIA component